MREGKVKKEREEFRKCCNNNTGACLTAEVCFKGGFGWRFVEGEGGMNEGTHTQDLQQSTLLVCMYCMVVCLQAISVYVLYGSVPSGY